MTIALSATTFDHENPNVIKDGIGVYSESLFHAFLKRGVDVLPVRYPRFWKPILKESLNCSYNHRYSYGVDYLHSCVVSSSSDERDLLGRGIGLYHSTDYRIPKLKNIPVVATLHDAVLLARPEWGSGGKFMRSLKNHVMRDVAQKADHIITISDFCTQEIVEYWGVEPKKVSTIHIGIQDFWHQKSQDEDIKAALRKYKLKPDFLLFVGTIQPRKNIKRVILSYLCLPRELRRKHKLVIVGKFGWKCEEEKKLILELEKEGIIKHIPNVNTRDLKCFYECAKLFLFPTLHEGFGIPVLEAMACSTAIVTSSNTASSEVGGDCVNLCDPTSIKSISNQMEKLLTDSLHAKQLAHKASLRSKSFSWDKACSETLKIYNALM